MSARPSTTERARRLLALLPYLRRGAEIPLSDLARVTGTDEERVADDLMTLSLCGTDPRDPSALIGVHVDGDVAIVFGELPALEEPVRLTAAELRALEAALESCGVSPDAALLERLAHAASQVDDPSSIAATVRAAAAPGGEAHTYAQFVAAVVGHRAMRIRYLSPGSPRESARVVHPLRLVSWRGRWYLVAYCQTAQDERTFRLDRVLSAEATGEVFEAPTDTTPSTVPVPDTDALPVAELRFAADAPDLTEREWPGATFERTESGEVLARVPYAGTGWIARKVAARLGDAEVVAPEEVRRAVAAMACRLLDN